MMVGRSFIKICVAAGLVEPCDLPSSRQSKVARRGTQTAVEVRDARKAGPLLRFRMTMLRGGGAENRKKRVLHCVQDDNRSTHHHYTCHPERRPWQRP